MAETFIIKASSNNVEIELSTYGKDEFCINIEDGGFDSKCITFTLTKDQLKDFINYLEINS